MLVVPIVDQPRTGNEIVEIHSSKPVGQKYTVHHTGKRNLYN